MVTDSNRELYNRLMEFKASVQDSPHTMLCAVVLDADDMGDEVFRQKLINLFNDMHRTQEVLQNHLDRGGRATMINFPPLYEVTMYQARCTNCGVIIDDYGDYSAWSDPSAPIEQVIDCNDWFGRWDGGKLIELLCPKCQRCEVCQSEYAYDVNDHLVCEEHEDHVELVRWQTPWERAE